MIEATLIVIVTTLLTTLVGIGLGVLLAALAVRIGGKYWP